jgi:ribosomal protein S18 acetylase RimI-like enzyme
MRVRVFRQDDLARITKIIREFHPRWFDKKALKNIPIDVQLQKCFVAEEKDRIVGFITIYSKDGEAELGWIGVKPERQRKGIGRKLLERAQKELKKIGVEILRAKTVGETRPRYKPYEETVEFYKACGFSLEKKSKFKEEKGYKYRMWTFKKILN